MRLWRNRQTRTFEGRMGDRMGSSPINRTIKKTTFVYHDKSCFFCAFRPENEPWRKKQFKNKEKHMKKFRTTVSVIIMILAGIAGFFAGSAVTDGMGGAILFSMIAGIGCIVYTADNRS